MLGRRGMGVALAAAMLAAMPLVVPAARPSSAQAQPANREMVPTVRQSVHNDTSPPLQEIGTSPNPAAFLAAEADAPVEQAAVGRMPPPKQSFEGLSNDDNIAVHGFPFLPPDPTGEAGPQHYLQAVNRAIGVFSKTGVMAPGFPKRIIDVWAGFGGACEAHTRGDPIVLYDQLADRWSISQFAEENGFAGPFFQCIAISATSDPTGRYHRYEFFYDATEINEYPKLAVWPDAYYMSVDEFIGSLDNPTGVGLVAFERDKMLDGLPAAQVQFEIPPHPVGLLPSDVDGFRLPPPGSPNYFVSLEDATADEPDRIAVWKFHVDFAAPATSTLTGPVTVPVAPYDSEMCGYLVPCIPQPNTSVKLQPFSHTIMFRAAYRNFGTHESIVFNHTVDVDGTDHAGIEYFELREPGSPAPLLAQQGRFAPDADHRWMGSVAMDRKGNLAVGYSVSGLQTFPSVRYAGRLVTDPPGVLARGEASLVEGSGSQLSLASRWGDYSHMSIDPTDDCTFWYTQEYYAVTSQQGWRTRIGSFEFPGCREPAATTTTVSSSANPSEFGGAVTFTAVVNSDPGQAAAPTGPVTFSIDGREVATVPLGPDGRAELTTATLAPGEHSVVATYGGDDHYRPSTSTPALAQRVTCGRTVTGRVAGPLVLDPGSWCVQQAIVGGSVTARPGAAVWISQSVINGDLATDGARAVALCSVAVRGRVSARNSTGLVLMGDPVEHRCAGNVVQGAVVLERNVGGVRVSMNVTDSLVLTANRGTGSLPENRGIEIEGNRIRRGLACTGNEPPPTNDGRPNSVGGTRTGQCSAAGF